MMKAEELLELAEGDPRAAIARAEEILGSADSNDIVARVTAFRAIGLARRSAGDAHGSVAALEKALLLARKDGDCALVGEVELSLSASLAFVGETQRAFALLDSAATRLDSLGVAHALTQRAGLVARSGDFLGALELYALAEPVLDEQDDRRWLALMTANRGLVFTYLGRFDEAERDLKRARDLYSSMGQMSSRAEMIHNLGFLAIQKGDIPQALQQLAEAEAQLVKLEMGLSELWLDRAEALLLVGIPKEAQSLARVAAAGLTAGGLEMERAEALIMEARAALMAGDLPAAREAGATAEALAARQGRDGWMLRARFFSLAAQSRTDVSVTAADLSRLADALEDAHQVYPARHARLLAGRVALESGDLVTAREQLTMSRGKGWAPVDLRLQGWLAEALLRRGEGDLAGAHAAARAGVRLLDEYRSILGSTESRANLAFHAVDLFALGLQVALSLRRPSSVLWWIDKSRGGVTTLVPPRPSDDPDLNSALGSLRRLQTEIRESELEGESARALLRRQVKVERQVRQISLGRALDERLIMWTPPLRLIQERLDRRVLVAFAEIGADLVAVRVREGSIRLHTLGPPERIALEAAHLRRALRALALDPTNRRVSSLLTAAKSLNEALLSPLRLRDERLIVVPPASTYSMPWPLLPGFGTRLSTLAPSPSAWLRAESATRTSEGSAVLVAGPRLSSAIDEVERIASSHDQPSVIYGTDATVANVLASLEGASIAHIACHARFRADNPMFSALELADGDLTVYDLETIRNPPAVVVLSACDTGLSEAAAGEELMGLSTALLALGTKSLVVSAVPLPDARPTVGFMQVLHGEFLAGSAMDAAMLAARRSISRLDDPQAFVAANGLIGIGA